MITQNKKIVFGDAKKADNNIKYCVICNRCWEYQLKESNYSNRVLYYQDFVIFGKQKQTCHACEGEINGKNKGTSN